MKYLTYEYYRNKAKKTDYQVAKDNRCITRAMLSNWHNKHITPKLDKQIVLAKYLNIPLEELAECDNEIKRTVKRKRN